jgi:uncharacterized lipoprotein YbaY/heat shock protein HslJ
MNKSAYFLALALCLPLTACDSGKESDVTVKEDAPATSITGSISLGGSKTLPSSALVEISLVDVSRQDARAKLIARQRITRPGPVPVEFELAFNPRQINERNSYAVQVRVTDGGRLLYVSDTNIPVLTRGAGNHADIRLVGVKSPRFGDPSGLGRLPSGKKDTGALELEGMFRYMADAALFRDCRSNKVFPVSMEGAYIELERAYLNSGIEAGNEVMVELSGRFLERPAMEGNHNEVKLIVDDFDNLLIENSCAPDVHAKLAGTYWKLLELGNIEVKTKDNRREAHMILALQDSRVKGHTGCSRLFGHFDTHEDSLVFYDLAPAESTCTQGLKTESAFLAALEATTRYEISGLIMNIYQQDQSLARFEAVYL